MLSVCWESVSLKAIWVHLCHVQSRSLNESVLVSGVGVLSLMNISASPLMCGGPLPCLPFPLLGLDRLGRAPQWAAWALGSECGLCSRARTLLLALDLGAGPWQWVRGEAVLRGALDESDFHLNQAGSSASNCPALAPWGWMSKCLYSCGLLRRARSQGRVQCCGEDVRKGRFALCLTLASLCQAQAVRSRARGIPSTLGTRGDSHPHLDGWGIGLTGPAGMGCDSQRKVERKPRSSQLKVSCRRPSFSLWLPSLSHSDGSCWSFFGL